PIALPDVVTALVDARDLPLPGSAWFDIPGPELLSARELLMTVAEIEDRRIPAARVPLLTPRLSSAWLKLISRTDYGVARELVLALEHDLLPRDRRYWELTAHPPRWSFHAAATYALRTERPERGVRGWLGRQEERAVRRLTARTEARSRSGM